MTSSRKGSSTRQYSVHGGVVDAFSRLNSVLHGIEMHNRQLLEQLLGIRIVQSMCLVVILASFQEKAVNETSISGSFFDVLMSDIVHNSVVVRNNIDRELVLSCIILKGASQEGLREEEAREPELNGSSIFNPVVQEVNSLIAIVNPGGKGLQRKESNLGPNSWHLIVEDGISKQLQFLRHDNFSNQSTKYGSKSSFHDRKASVVTHTLLIDNCIHRLKIGYWEFLANYLKVKYRRGPCLYEFSLFADDFFTCLTFSSTSPRLHGDHVSNKLNNSQLRSSNLSIFVQTESLRLGV